MRDDEVLKGKSKAEFMVKVKRVVDVILTMRHCNTPQYEDQQEQGWQNREAKSVSEDGTDKETG